MPESQNCCALVVDLDGVLRRFDPAAGIRLERRLGLPAGIVTSFAHAAQLLEPALTGAISDATWRYRVAEELAALFGDAPAAEAVTAWAAERGEIDAAVLGLVSAVSVPVVLFTDATTRLESDLAAAGLDGAFAAVVSSARTGVTKPDPAAFAAAEQAVARVGRSSGPIAYVDDSAANVAAARARGWRAWRFTDVPRMRGFLDRHRLLADGT